MSRRHQKRIEHELIDLINSKENSNKCGECSATHPTWASVNLGIFLCGRCASLHRNLGDDISVVKSLTLDRWVEDDIDNISRIGNKKAKKFWNPKGIPFPFDEDDKDELILYVRQKYINGKFRYSPPVEEDYNLGGHRSRVRSDSNSRSFSRPSLSPDRRTAPRLTHRDIPEIERLKYRKLEPKLKDQGFNNTNDNYEALYLSKGDLKLASKILQNSSQEDPNEVKPALPRRPGTSTTNTTSSAAQQPQSSSSNDWWSANSSNQGLSNATSQTGTGLLEPPQQYLDPATGIVYVDPIQQQQYLQQQQQLQAHQQQAQFLQQPVGTPSSFLNSQQQLSQPTGAFVQSQKTGIDKNQLLSLYNTGNQQQQFQQQQFQQPLQNQYNQNPFGQQQQFYQNGYGLQ